MASSSALVPPDPTRPFPDDALLALVGALHARAYRFVTPTPASHARRLAWRAGDLAGDLRDIFGWSLPFEPGALDPELLAMLEAANALEPLGGARLRSRYRVSSLCGGLYLHSAYPTVDKDAVFFGPDSYRFADLIARELHRRPLDPGERLVDIGAGAGVGALVAAGLSREAEVMMTDINPAALRLAAVNARAAGVEAALRETGNLDGVEGRFQLALANPPFIVDADGRDYRDGGGMHGGAAALAMTRAALPRLAPGGRLILYGGSAIVDGRDALHDALAAAAVSQGCAMAYAEIDPDIFGEELAQPAYREVERIAAIGAIFTKTI